MRKIWIKEIHKKDIRLKKAETHNKVSKNFKTELFVIIHHKLEINNNKIRIRFRTGIRINLYHLHITNKTTIITRIARIS